ENNYAFAILAGIVYVGVLLGSKYFTVISIIVPFFIIVEALILFLKGENLRKFITINGIIVFFALLGNIFLAIYHGGFAVSGFTLYGIFIPINLALLIMAMFFAVLLSIDWSKYKYANKFRNKKLSNLLIAVGIIVLVSIPVLPKVIDYGAYLISFSQYGGLPLFKTVQEFTPSPIMDMSGYFGILLGSPYVYFSIIGIFTIILAYKFYKHSNGILDVLLIPTIYPLFYTSLSLAKYISDGGIVLILALAYIIAEIMARVIR
ncbi:MAG: hypothetical protein QXH07_04620, partial [Thermoplasmata archaeon]